MSPQEVPVEYLAFLRKWKQAGIALEQWEEKVLREEPAPTE